MRRLRRPPCLHLWTRPPRRTRPRCGHSPTAQQRQVWQEAVTTAPGGKVTGAHVQQVADKAKGQAGRVARPTLPPHPGASSGARRRRRDRRTAPGPRRPARAHAAGAGGAGRRTRTQLAVERTLRGRARACRGRAGRDHQPTIVLHEAQVAQAARLFLGNPAFNAAAAMLGFSAREEAV